MYSAILVVCSLLSTALMAQSTDGNLRSELEAQHVKWFKAFDSGDGATMDQMEIDNLVLVIPHGTLFAKTEARAFKHRKLDPLTERVLSDVSVRRFGDTAVLTGILTTQSTKEHEKDATTVVFASNPYPLANTIGISFEGAAALNGSGKYFFPGSQATSTAILAMRDDGNTQNIEIMSQGSSGFQGRQSLFFQTTGVRLRRGLYPVTSRLHGWG